MSGRVIIDCEVDGNGFTMNKRTNERADDGAIFLVFLPAFYPLGTKGKS